MKYVKLISSYFRGIIFSSVFVSVIMGIAMFLGVLIFSKVQYMVNDHMVIKTHTLSDPYYVQQFVSIEESIRNPEQLQEKMAQQIASLKNMPAVENVFTIQTVNPIEYDDYGISIRLYDPGLIDAFPMLFPANMRFDSDPSGCILGSRVFNALRPGDMIHLDFFRPQPSTQAFSVNGHLTSPYRYLSFNISSTTLYTEHLLQSGEVIIMLATPENIERLSSIAEVVYDTNYIISFSESASAEEKEQVLASVSAGGIVSSIQDSIERSDTRIMTQIKESLPLPLFLLCVTTVAFLSISLLNVRKKAQEMAICYLCGSSRKMYTRIAVSANCIIAFVPFLFNVLFVLTAPYLDWMEKLNLGGITVTGSALIPIILYLLISVALSFAATIIPLSKQSPISYIRGIEQ